MTTLTNNRFRSSSQRSWNRAEASLQDVIFLEKEARFFIRLLDQCETANPDPGMEKEYQSLKDRFRAFQQSLKQRGKNTRAFNPLNQTVSARPETDRSHSPETLLRDYQELKQEAFQRIGRFFSVRIR